MKPRFDLPRRCQVRKVTHLLAQALSAMEQELVVIGDGPEWAKMKHLAGQSVKLLRYQSDELVAHYLQRAKAFVFAAD